MESKARPKFDGRTMSTFANAQDPVVICCALRTPICKAKRGSFANTTPDHLLATVLRAVVERSGIDPASIGDVVVGNVLQPGGGAVSYYSITNSCISCGARSLALQHANIIPPLLRRPWHAWLSSLQASHIRSLYLLSIDNVAQGYKRLLMLPPLFTADCMMLALLVASSL